MIVKLDCIRELTNKTQTGDELNSSFIFPSAHERFFDIYGRDSHQKHEKQSSVICPGDQLLHMGHHIAQKFVWWIPPKGFVCDFLCLSQSPGASADSPATGMGQYRYRVLLFVMILSLVNCPPICSSVSWFPYHYVQQRNRQFEQKTDRFWEYDEHTKTWTEVELPRELVSCVDGNCTKISLIRLGTRRGEEDQGGKGDEGGEPRESSEVALPRRKSMSLSKMSETSIWITGESGSIYERFWNGAQWVIAPHNLPVTAGRATSVFFVNQTILALSEAGQLYQVHSFSAICTILISSVSQMI